MAEQTFKVGHITFTRATKQACEDAHYEIAHKHAWGDKTNAGVNYKPKKNADKFKQAMLQKQQQEASEETSND